MGATHSLLFIDSIHKESIQTGGLLVCVWRNVVHVGGLPAVGHGPMRCGRGCGLPGPQVLSRGPDAFWGEKSVLYG